MHVPRQNEDSVLAGRQALLVALLTIASFHLAYSFASMSWLIGVYVWGLCTLAGVQDSRKAFYLGLAIGLAIYGPQLNFFWRIFGPSGIALWLVLAFWLGLFVLLAHITRWSCGRIAFALLVPFLWLGLEYFRSELYFLRFSWLNAGYVFSESPWLPYLAFLGIYGIGFILIFAFGLLSLLPGRMAFWGGSILLVLLAISVNSRATVPSIPRQTASNVRVAGMQLEFPAELEVPLLLDKLIQKQPEAQLLVLSDYTFDGPVPERVKAWCRKNQRYLIVGGKAAHQGTNFFNTAFVVGPTGEIVFQQAKSVPIQFFKDGQPAELRKVWDSPWGKIGICICYDLSYTKVTDDFIRQGAEALIVPTMDVMEWGGHQHRLHARIAPVRAAEYGVPIFRLASSGISQIVDRRGIARASAGIGGGEEIIAGTLDLGTSGRRPFDRFLAPLSVAITSLLMGWFILTAAHRRPRTSLPLTEISHSEKPLSHN
jgi:apolipoprotein N-acyltransferase